MLLKRVGLSAGAQNCQVCRSVSIYLYADREEPQVFESKHSHKAPKALHVNTLVEYHKKFLEQLTSHMHPDATEIASFMVRHIATHARTTSVASNLANSCHRLCKKRGKSREDIIRELGGRDLWHEPDAVWESVLTKQFLQDTSPPLDLSAHEYKIVTLLFYMATFPVTKSFLERNREIGRRVRHLKKCKDGSARSDHNVSYAASCVIRAWKHALTTSPLSRMTSEMTK